MAASVALTVKLRDEARSRSGTPEMTDSSGIVPPMKHIALGYPALKSNIRASRSTTPETQQAGIKRKAEVGNLFELTPPLKKVA